MMNFAPHPQPTIYRTWPDVVGRLQDLDLAPDILSEVVKFAFAHFAECTPHDPKSGPGFNLWSKGVRGLRDRLVILNWKSGSASNYETVIHKSGLWQVTVAGADAHTGLDGPSPTTRTDKGRATERAIDLNQQSQAQGTLIAGMFPTFTTPVRQTWILLIHVDQMNAEVRSELSRPVGFDENRHVSWWDERILLPSIPYHEAMLGSSQNDDEDGGDLNIDVPRRVG